MRNRFFSFLFLLALCHSATAQLAEKANLVYRNNAYDVFVIAVDSVNAKNCWFEENLTHASESDYFDKLSGKGTFFAITASIVDSSCRPLGLFIQDGKKVAAINRDTASNGNFFKLTNGFLAVDHSNAVIIAPSDAYQDGNYKLAIQSGPMLLLDRRVNAKFDSASHNRSMRCGVGMYKEKNRNFLVFARSLSGVTFYDISLLFKEKYSCTNALTLETGSFCSLHLPTIKQNYSTKQGACRYFCMRL